MPSSTTCLVCGGTDARPRFAKGGKTFYRCRACTFVWLAPLPTPAELDAHYAWTYTQGPYTVFAAADDVRTLIARDRLATLRPLLGDGPCLDVGASTGAFVAAARDAGVAAEGIELSEAAVAAAQRAGLPVTVARIEDFAPPTPYRAVTAFDVIEHLLDPRVLLERARTWLQPGGALALTLPDIGSAAARLLGKWWYFYAPLDHFHYWDRHTISRFLTRNGFRVERVARATKPLTVGYVARQLGVFYGPLGVPARVLLRLPGAVRDRPIPIPVGEMLVVARRDG